MSTQPFDTRPNETDEMPAIPHLVLYAGVPFYSDAECTTQVGDASLVILEPLDPVDTIHELDVAPTRREYKVGQFVTWELNNKKLWETCWYRNPETGRIEQAWAFHVEFTGSVISQATVDANAQKLQDMAVKVQELRGKNRVN